MKLFTKYNRINVLFTIIVFLLASIAFSFLLKYVIINQVDEDLRIERNEVLTYVQKYGSLPAIIEVHDQYTNYKEAKTVLKKPEQIYTKKQHDKRNDGDELMRSILFNATVNGKLYLITVSKSLEGTDNLIQSIIFITIATIILILTVTVFINRFVLYKLWQPFYNTLETVQQFTLSDNKAISFTDSQIEEFDLLNTTLSTSINKAQQDYIVLKEFTENASHEMQTPLAIIRSKLDVMIQSEDLTEAQSQSIQVAYDAIKKLKKMNQSLLLLAKIDNRQFTEKTDIDLYQAIADKQEQFIEQWQSQHIQMQTEIVNATINGNQHLIDILLNNLFSNAIRHNISNGSIILHLQPHLLEISNTGEPDPLEKHLIFSRFYKGNSMSGQHGLGLSIVKQICDVSGYRCRYQFQLPNIHLFTINW